MYKVVMSRRALKFKENLDLRAQHRINDLIERLKANPYAVKHKRIESKKHKGTRRARTGDFRVLYIIYKERYVVEIMKIRHRKNVYKK